MPTTCASNMLRDYTPPFDATVVDIPRREGVNLVGKTNLDEFGMGSLDAHIAFGISGGSSGGSAAALAAGLCDAALGTDTSGSQRLRGVLTSLREAGAELVPVSLPNTKYALGAYYVLASAEASSNVARYDGVQYGLQVPPHPHQIGTVADTYALSRTAGFGTEVQKRILLGAYALSAEYVALIVDNYFLKAQRLRLRNLI
ncbi:amidase signature enzyme [Peniophora sp. CONT]|nr:amidase signature enzyme [Peniophora sp. CONT]